MPPVSLPRAAVLAAALAGAALALAPAASAGDIRQVWRTIETAHFQIHYYEPHGDIARKVAASAEMAHATLVDALGHEPEEKTHIVLLDDTDSSNGFASVLPRNRITLYASAPPDNSSLSDNDDWLYNLTAHEYTHIVHLDTIGGIPRLVNRLTGKTWAPNQVQPRWVIEGLATYQESRRSSAGRTRHALFDTDLRMATLSGEPLRLDEMSSGPRRYPHGNAAYLYGSHFLKYVFDRHGEDKAAGMSSDYGSRVIPYALNKSIERQTGRTFVELYDDWRTYREARYGLQAEAVARSGRREGRRLTFTGENNLNPHYSPDGRTLVWQRGDGYSEGQFRAMPAGGHVGQSETYAVVERTGQFALLRDGSMVVEQTHIFRGEYSFQELVRWDRTTGRVDTLTVGARASDPAVSPDERTVAFVKNGAGRRELAVMPLEPGGAIRVLWRGPGRYDQAFSPAWSPDGRRIAFAAWREGGRRDILIAEVATGRIQELSSDRAQDIEPAWSPDGRFVYHASDRTGIFNIYAHELATGRLWQVTNVLGCAAGPTVSPDGRRMVYQGCVADGNELYEIDLEPARFTEAPPYVDDRPDPVTVREDAVEISAPRPYRAMETMAPRSYSAGFVANSLGQALQLDTAGGDVVGHHGYRLATTIGLDYRGVNVGGSYSYRRLWPSLSLALARTVSSRGGYIIDGVNTRFTEEALRGTVSVGLPVVRDPDGNATISLDYDVDVLRNLSGELHEDDPNDILPRLPDSDTVLAGIALRWSYGDSRGTTYTVGPQWGKDLSVALRFDHPALGADATSVTMTYRGTWYQQIPVATHPSLMLRLSGGVRATNRDRIERFGIGGVPDSQDLVQALIDNLRASSTGYLRGYPVRHVTGTQFHLANLELRQELWNIERGISTLPLFIRRMHVAGLLDAGDAFDDELDPSRVKVGAGGALRLDFTMGFGMPGSLELGYARGFSEGGTHETWLLLIGTL